MLYHTISSSTFALERTLSNVVDRLEQSDEKKELEEMLLFCRSIKENAKGKELLNALAKGFEKLKGLGAKQKAIIFTENKATLKYLYELLNKGKYKNKVLTYSGDNTRDYSIMSRFQNEMQILITTDIAAEGFNLEFCSFVINYDLPYNILKIEQRINRCHRQDQECDVIILNFINKSNFADIRLLELINKRILQFDGVFGLSDDIIGNFEVDMADVLSTARAKSDIEKIFKTVLDENEDLNRELTQTAEQSLFSSFSKEIAQKVTITPQYVADKTKEINDRLWELTKYFLQGKSGYELDDGTRTVHISLRPQKVFTGAHVGRREYSMTDKTLPKSGWHTITGTLAKNILSEIKWIGIHDRGTVVVECEIADCTIGYYRIKVKSQNDYFSAWCYNVFAGITTKGQVLSHEYCVKLMNLPVATFSVHGDTYGERDGMTKEKRQERLDRSVNPNEFLTKAFEEMNEAEAEEIERLKIQAEQHKAELTRNLETLKSSLKTAEIDSQGHSSRLDRLDKRKKSASIQRELMQREQSLFFDILRLETELERQINEMIEKSKLTAELQREFIIQVLGGNRNGEGNRNA